MAPTSSRCTPTPSSPASVSSSLMICWRPAAPSRRRWNWWRSWEGISRASPSWSNSPSSRAANSSKGMMSSPLSNISRLNAGSNDNPVCCFPALFPAQPGCFFLKGDGMAFEVGDGGEAEVEERDDMIFGFQPQPCFDTRLKGGIARAPHSGEAHLFGDQQHILCRRRCRLYILDCQHLW